jgi:hypothetical protein
MEAGTVEVGVELRGNLSFPIDITVNVNFATAICKSKYYLHIFALQIYYAMTLCITTAELDYFGVPINLTFTGASIESIVISIVDDDLVERPEVIQLLLTTLTPGMILIDPNTALIEITDNDRKLFP